VKLNHKQEFLIYMMWLRNGWKTDILAERFFGRAHNESMRRIDSILRTYCCAIYDILKVENWWVSPQRMHDINSMAFEQFPHVLCISDCTNVNTGSSQSSELIRQQLYSIYYKNTCGKYNVTCSVVGGCVSCGPGMGGPASDHECMERAGLFNRSKWEVEDDETEPQMLYDAGVSAKTKTAAMLAGCDLLTSGIVRNSAKSTHSYIQRASNYTISGRRIRVENFIGIVKNRFRILQTKIPITMLGMLDKIVYTCFMLHNFGSIIIN
jgi:hypothetical protein